MICALLYGRPSVLGDRVVKKEKYERTKKLRGATSRATGDSKKKSKGMHNMPLTTTTNRIV